MDAWLNGAFVECIELCDTVRRTDATTRVHLALLKARALMRLNRPDSALRVLRALSVNERATDEYVTSQMLLGAAYVHRGDAERGLAVLHGTEAIAESAHRTIRSELAFYIALAHYSRGDFDSSERFLNRVSADADIVYARALQCRAFIAHARTDIEQARELFIAALAALDGCARNDRYVEINIVRGLAHCAAEALDPQAWSIVDERRRRTDWAVNAVTDEVRFWVAYCAAAFSSDFLGDPLAAARETREAERLAPSEAYTIQALCKRASIMRRHEQSLSHRDHTAAAVQAFSTLRLSELSDDELSVPYIVVEELVFIDPPAA